MTDVCMDYCRTTVEPVEGERKSIFKLKKQGNVMTHQPRDNAGLAAPSADGPTSPKSRAGAPPHADRARPDVSARRDAAVKAASRLSETPGARVHDVSHEAAAPPSLHSRASPCGKQLALGFLEGLSACNVNAAAASTESTKVDAVTLPTTQERARVEELMLVAGLMDDHLEVFTAKAMGVEHSKLRRLADKDRSLIPVIGRRG